MFHKQRLNFVVMTSVVLLTTFIAASKSLAFDDEELPTSNPHFRDEGNPFDTDTSSSALTPHVVTRNVTGTNAFTLLGDGTLTFPGANSYTGATNINGGTLSLNQSYYSSSGMLNNGRSSLAQPDSNPGRQLLYR